MTYINQTYTEVGKVAGDALFAAAVRHPGNYETLPDWLEFFRSRFTTFPPAKFSK